MLNIFATKKVLDVSKVKPLATNSTLGNTTEQPFTNWYVSSMGSGFVGKTLMLYVHSPSLLTIVVKGKTIRSTFGAFLSQLEGLASRFGFPFTFPLTEKNFERDCSIFKTNDRSMLGHINELIYTIVCWAETAKSYDTIDTNKIEDYLMGYLYKVKGTNDYSKPILYWETFLGFKHDPLPDRQIYEMTRWNPL
jgi:hypothetical protein